MEEDQYLIIMLKGTNRFVQFAAGGFYGMRAEAVCNTYLQGSQRLTREDIAVLGALGWNHPTSGAGVGPSEDPDGSPNYYREWPEPVHHADIAELTVRTLIEVYDVPHPGWLQYEAFDLEGEKLHLAGLGLKEK